MSEHHEDGLDDLRRAYVGDWTMPDSLAEVCVAANHPGQIAAPVVRTRCIRQAGGAGVNAVPDEATTLVMPAW